jgi:alpha-galactosidase
MIGVRRIAPEQGASWASTQPDWDNQRNVMIVINSLLGRVHLSGNTNLLSSQHSALIASSMLVYEQLH